MSISDLQTKPTGIILAGGKSSRMGKDKALIKLGDKTFTEIIFQTIAPFCSSVLISTNNPDLHFRGAEIVPDIIKDIGPLGGIYSCLKYSQSFKNIIVTADTPLINKDLIEFLLKQSDDHDVTYCEYDNKEHPLIGVYTKNFLKILEKDIKKGKFKTLAAIKKSFYKRHIISNEHPVFKKDLFMNINEPKDLQKLQEKYGLK